MTQISETVTKRQFLQPDYRPEGIVSNVSTAIGLINEAGLKIPRPSSPKCNFEDWRRIIDLFSIDVIDEVANSIEHNGLSNAFKTLSMKVNDNSPYEVSDIVKINISSNIEDSESSENHISHVFKYCIQQLPPVTSALIGGYLSEVRVYGREEYKNDILPEDKSYGGLHRPYRRCIEIHDSCSCWMQNGTEDYPRLSCHRSCIFLHELGHTVHNLYGFIRPGDGGYEYPSPRDSLDSTGCINPISLTSRQSKFVYDVFRSYTYTHMDCYENLHYRHYGQQHPVESFACAFDILLRNGTEKILDEYIQFHDVFSHLI